ALALNDYPAHVGDLFYFVFPDEQFQFGTSANRIHQLCHRLRAFLADTGIHLTSQRGFYQLEAEPGACLVVRDVEHGLPPSETGSAKAAHSLHRMKTEFGSKPFKIAEASSFLEMSTRSVYRVLRLGLVSGQVIRTVS